MTEREIITRELDYLREKIIQNMDAAGQTTTGKTAKSMKVEVEPTATGWIGRLTARPYFGALETGSRPWKTPYPKPPKFFVDIIAEWAEAKNLTLSPYLTARRIMLEGSSLYRKGGRDDIYSQEIPATIETLKDRMSEFFMSITTETIKINTK